MISRICHSVLLFHQWMSVTYHLIHQLLIIPDGRVIKQMTEPVVMFGMHLMDPFFFFCCCCSLLWSNYFGLCQRLEERLCLDLQIGSNVTNNFLWELLSCGNNWSWLLSQDQYFKLMTSLWKPWIYAGFFRPSKNLIWHGSNNQTDVFCAELRNWVF